MSWINRTFWYSISARSFVQTSLTINKCATRSDMPIKQKSVKKTRKWKISSLSTSDFIHFSLCAHMNLTDISKCQRYTYKSWAHLRRCARQSVTQTWAHADRQTHQQNKTVSCIINRAAHFLNKLDSHTTLESKITPRESAPPHTKCRHPHRQISQKHTPGPVCWLAGLMCSPYNI